MADWTQDANCVGAWLFTEGSGEAIDDAASGDNDGAFKGVGEPAWNTDDVPFGVSGSAPNSVVFDGSDDLITIENESNFDFAIASAFSVSFWIKPNITRSGGEVNYACITKLNGSSPYEGWEIGIKWTGSATVLHFDLISSVNSTQVAVKGSTDLSNGTWYHAVVTYSGNQATSGVIMYINANGETEATVTDNFSGEMLNNLAVGFGGRTSGTYRAYTAYNQTDTGIFSDVLDSTEVTEIYSYGLQPTVAGGAIVRGYMTTNKGYWG
jgi:hypothetical protein